MLCLFLLLHTLSRFVFVSNLLHLDLVIEHCLDLSLLLFFHAADCSHLLLKHGRFVWSPEGRACHGAASTERASWTYGGLTMVGMHCWVLDSVTWLRVNPLGERCSHAWGLVMLQFEHLGVEVVWVCDFAATGIGRNIVVSTSSSIGNWGMASAANTWVSSLDIAKLLCPGELIQSLVPPIVHIMIQTITPERNALWRASLLDTFLNFDDVLALLYDHLFLVVATLVQCLMPQINKCLRNVTLLFSVHVILVDLLPWDWHQVLTCET